MKNKTRTVRTFRHRVHLLDCNNRPVFRVTVPFFGTWLVPERTIARLGGWNAASELILQKHSQGSLESLFNP